MTSRELVYHSSEEEAQPKPFIIGVTNDIHGAGSTTTAKLLTRLLEFGYEDPGNATRQMAVDQGYATDLEDDEGLLRFEQEVVSKNPNIDIELDTAVISKAIAGNYVIEGTAAVILAKAGLIPDEKGPLSSVEPQFPIFTVLLTCNPRVAAQRVLLRKELRRRNIDPSTVSPETRQVIIDGLNEEQVNSQMDTSQRRKETPRQNWDRLYRLSDLEKGEGAFDLPKIDTTNLTPEQVVDLILTQLQKGSYLSQKQLKEAQMTLHRLIHHYRP
jgi:cytidylate kinase